MADHSIPVEARIAVTVEYDGSAFNGWQFQIGDNVKTVQAALETALSRVADQPVRVSCAGRTDSGVHATNQIVHFDAPAARSTSSWLLGANAHLADSVVVKHVQQVAPDFHARFSAVARRYRYLIHNAPVASAAAVSRVHWVRHELSVKAMHTAAQALLGEQDFSAFRAAFCQSSTPMRRVDFAKVFRHGELVIIDIQANAFLHHMVRNITGALIAVGRGQIAVDAIARLLAEKDRTLAPATASPAGLYLVGVSYPDHFGLLSHPPGPLFLAGLE